MFLSPLLVLFAFASMTSYIPPFFHFIANYLAFYLYLSAMALFYIWEFISWEGCFSNFTGRSFPTENLSVSGPREKLLFVSFLRNLILNSIILFVTLFSQHHFISIFYFSRLF